MPSSRSVIPQIVAATLLGPVLRTFFGGEPIYALIIAGGSLIVGALCLAFVREPRTAPAAAIAAAH